MNTTVWILVVLSLCLTQNVYAVEQKISGIVDVRATATDGLRSFVDGGLGKFRFNPQTQVSLAQGGLSYQATWDNGIGAHVVANAYWDGVKDNVGITEAYLSYKSLPWDNGFRVTAKTGIIYPHISLENIATAWSSPYTLSYSSINSWFAEEVRHIGANVGLQHLGKFSQSEHDFGFNVETFINNDTTGAMLAWHGWTLSSRQTLWQEHIPLSAIPARNDGGMLAGQAAESDPFIELDNRLGYHFSGNWQWRGKGKVNAGYYNNNADTRVVKQGQYAWLTRFGYVGSKWRLPNGIDFIGQYLQGDTMMRSPYGMVVVDNDYHSAYLLFSKRWQAHRLTVRLEDFAVKDNDNTLDDDNSENGQAYSVSYAYQLRKGWFLQGEYNLIDSERPARAVQGASAELLEQQWQLASRYYF